MISGNYYKFFNAPKFLRIAGNLALNEAKTRVMRVEAMDLISLRILDIALRFFLIASILTLQHNNTIKNIVNIGR
jgi:hypothetical protein